MCIKIDNCGKLTVTERRVTHDGTCYDEETDVGLIHKPMPEYDLFSWRVYFYVGAHRGGTGEFNVSSKDEAISKLIRAYLYPTERLF